MMNEWAQAPLHERTGKRGLLNVLERQASLDKRYATIQRNGELH